MHLLDVAGDQGVGVVGRHHSRGARILVDPRSHPRPGAQTAQRSGHRREDGLRVEPDRGPLVGHLGEGIVAISSARKAASVRILLTSVNVTRTRPPSGTASTWIHTSSPSGRATRATTPRSGFPLRMATIAGWRVSGSGHPAVSVRNHPAWAALVPTISLSEAKPRMSSAVALARITRPPASYAIMAPGSWSNPGFDARSKVSFMLEASSALLK